MAPEDNKAVVRRFFEEAMSTNDMALVDTLLARTYVDHTSQPQEATREQFNEWWSNEFHPAFPDWHFTVEDLLADGDKVIARVTGHGTHQGAWMGVAPTGEHVAVTAIHIFQLADGKITDNWSSVDTFGLMLRIGAITKVAG